MIIIYEIPILLIALIVLGILGIGMQYVNTIMVICVITYVLFEMLFVYGVLHNSKVNMLKNKNVDNKKVKKMWLSMYICALFRILIITITLCLTLGTYVDKIENGSFFDMLFGWGDGILTYLSFGLVSCISWFIALKIGGNVFDGYGGEMTTKKVVIFNIFQIVSSLALCTFVIAKHINLI